MHIQMQENDIRKLREGLVAAINTYVSDQTILDAFRSIDRHLFVPMFLDGKGWTRKVTAEENEEEWLRGIYTNRPLTTSLDIQGYPNCSSSQPNLMAQMLEAIKIRRGSRVLEIGTGTGYNAALLAHIVGPENVTTVDINESLLEVARERIERAVGPGVTILHEDGRNLPEWLRDFDAIIVTGAHERIEPCWISVLKPGGRLVMNWYKRFARVMLEAERVDNRLVGRVAYYDGDFMGLHDGQGIERHKVVYEQLPLVDMMFPSSWFDDQDFGFFLQLHLATRFHWYRKPQGKIYVIREQERITQFFENGVIHGDLSLAKEIIQIALEFEKMGRPSRLQYTFTADIDGKLSFFYKDRVFDVPGLVGHY